MRTATIVVIFSLVALLAIGTVTYAYRSTYGDSQGYWGGGHGWGMMGPHHGGWWSSGMQGGPGMGSYYGGGYRGGGYWGGPGNMMWGGGGYGHMMGRGHHGW